MYISCFLDFGSLTLREVDYNTRFLRKDSLLFFDQTSYFMEGNIPT